MSGWSLSCSAFEEVSLTSSRLRGEDPTAIGASGPKLVGKRMLVMFGDSKAEWLYNEWDYRGR